MEVPLFTSATSLPPQTKAKETILSLPISKPSIMSRVGGKANPTLHANMVDSTLHLNSRLQENLSVQSERHHNEDQPFSRISKDMGAALTVEETREYQEWEEALDSPSKWPCIRRQRQRNARRRNQQGLGEEALELFEIMESEGLKPDEATFASILKACSFMEALEQGRQLHNRILECGLELDAIVASSLVAVYAKCGSMKDSQDVFDRAPHKDVVSWNALISGYALHGPWQEALSLFDRMRHAGFEANTSTYVSVFKSCASLAALEQGQNVFLHLVKSGIDSDMLLNSTLVDFFAKCGCLDDADYVFQSMPKHDVVSWTAMIIAYAQQGFAKDAVLFYERMKGEGIQPNEVTFVGVLNACNHAGLVQEALQYFKSMKDVYGITPTASHCACLVDLLGRAGHLVEAADLMEHLPTDTDEVSWLALLAACRSSNDVDLAKHAVDQVLEQKSDMGAAYVLLSNISAG